MSAITTFILVDDDSINNMICKLTIKKALGDVEIAAFTEPEKGLEYLENKYNEIVQPTILLLDINMPTMSGWEFLAKYENFDETVKKQIKIYMLSSSVDQRDKDKASASQYVAGFLSKPLNTEKVIAVASETF